MEQQLHHPPHHFKPDEGEEKQTVTKKLANKSMLITKILGAALIVLVLVTIYLVFSKGGVLDKQSQVADEIAELKNEISAYEGDKVGASADALTALKVIEAEELKWSAIIKAVDNLIPKEPNGQPSIVVLSYSGSAEGRIALSVSTLAKVSPPYVDVARLLSDFNNSVLFKDAYIPSLSTGVDESGRELMSFVFNLTYDEPELGNTASVGASGEDAPAPRVKVQNN